MSSLMFHILILIHFIIKNWCVIWYHLMKRSNYLIEVSPDLKESTVIKFLIVYLSKIWTDVSEKLCWKHKVFFFRKWKRERSICCYMSEKQYKLGKNTKNVCLYCCFVTPVDVYFVDVLYQHFVYVSQVHWFQYICRFIPSECFLMSARKQS